MAPSLQPSLDEILAAAPVIPVLTIDRAADAPAIARALVAGGLPVMEVTLRTPAALAAIRAMREVPGALVGAGTVLDRDHLEAAIDAGAAFLVSPGLTGAVAEAMAAAALPCLPGVATASEIMRARELGFIRLKFFPAEASGGVPALKALSATFPDLRFCPTGGLTQDNAQSWLDLPAVACVGGSWLVPAGEPIDPGAIARRAKAAAALRRP
jgi:2-dehydro-3-deoxyphosphogluconate aldolase / (4S)-4-hydroxy-2-oxoglutarate aldolase